MLIRTSLRSSTFTRAAAAAVTVMTMVGCSASAPKSHEEEQANARRQDLDAPKLGCPSQPTSAAWAGDPMALPPTTAQGVEGRFTDLGIPDEAVDATLPGGAIVRAFLMTTSFDIANLVDVDPATAASNSNTVLSVQYDVVLPTGEESLKTHCDYTPTFGLAPAEGTVLINGIPFASEVACAGAQSFGVPPDRIGDLPFMLLQIAADTLDGPGVTNCDTNTAGTAGYDFPLIAAAAGVAGLGTVFFADPPCQGQTTACINATALVMGGTYAQYDTVRQFRAGTLFKQLRDAASFVSQIGTGVKLVWAAVQPLMSAASLTCKAAAGQCEASSAPHCVACAESMETDVLDCKLCQGNLSAGALDLAASGIDLALVKAPYAVVPLLVYAF